MITEVYVRREDLVPFFADVRKDFIAHQVDPTYGTPCSARARGWRGCVALTSWVVRRKVTSNRPIFGSPGLAADCCLHSGDSNLLRFPRELS